MKNTSLKSSLEKLDVDIAVVGGGGAGLAAAVTAAERGATVVVLEKRRTLGGNSAMAEGFFAAESPAQQRMMIDAGRDQLFKIAMNYSHWRTNPRIIRAFIDKSGDTVRWLEDMGLTFDWIPPLYPDQVIRTWHCIKGGGITITKVLTGNCENLGVPIYCQSAVKKILTDGKGRVNGVIADLNGEVVGIKARSVIIATGGYGGNKKLLKKYFGPEIGDMVCVGLPHKGEGLLMAIEAGAATEGLGMIQTAGPHARKSDYFSASRNINATASEPDTLWVNKKGERFTDETIGFMASEAANTIDRQPGNISYTLLDERKKQNIIENGFIKGIGVVILPQGTKPVGLDRELNSEARKEKGEVRISDSWDEIAGWMEADPMVLKATVDEYNSFCDRGYDSIFNKDRMFLTPLRTPPYYAVRCCLSFLGTIGGIKINHHMEVLDPNDNPVPGLYATGCDAGGWESDTYCAVLSGSTFGFALNSGRIAAENAVRYVR